MSKKKKVFILLIVVSLALKAWLSVSTLHADLLGHSFTAYFFSEKGILNVYQHLLDLPQHHPLVKNFGVHDIFIYPPLTYFTLGIFRVMAKPFIDMNFITWAWQNISNIYQYQNLGNVLFWFKIFYLPFDLLLGILMYKLFKNENKARLAFFIWLFNPVNLYVTYMIGQFDLLPTFFVFLSFYLLSKKRFNWGLISLGVATAYKMFPLFLLIPVAVLYGDSLKQKIKNLAIGLSPFILTILPFLNSPAFRSMVLFSPKSQKMLFMQLKVSGAEGIYPFLFVYTLIILTSWYQKEKNKLLLSFVGVLLLILALTHFHPQWFLWVTPFLIFMLIKCQSYWVLILGLFLSWLGITFLFEPSLTIGLFAPINPYLAEAKGLRDILPMAFSPVRVKSMLRSVFAACAAFVGYFLVKDNGENE